MDPIDQIKIDNNTGEEGAFIWLTSIVDWINVTFTGNVLLIHDLNYSNSKDTSEIDIYLKSPQNEDPGSKSSTITFESSFSEEFS